jgi:hypothetical protein
MRLLHFLGRFFFFITILIIIWYPFANKYLFSSTNVLTVASLFIFYLPLNLIPFFALTLATPLEKSKLIKIIMMGSSIIIIFTVLIIGFQFKFPAINTELFFIYAIGRISIPIIVWLGFVYDDIIGISLQKNSSKRITKKI